MDSARASGTAGEVVPRADATGGRADDLAYIPAQPDVSQISSGLMRSFQT